MFKHCTWIAAAAFAGALAGPIWAEEPPSADQVVATVNGTEITLGHMIAVRAGLPEQLQSMPDEVLFTGILDQLVEQTLMAEKIGTPVPMRVRIALENERRSLMASEEISRVLKLAVNDTRIAEAYEATYGSGEPDLEYNAAHILVETEREAQEIVEMLKEGADFAGLAKTKSTGPSGPGGGALGWFGKGRMVPAFEAAVAALEDGAISDPVKTRFGWHVIKLNETRVKDAPSLEEVRGELEQQVAREAMDSYIEELSEKATIERVTPSQLDPTVLSNIDLLAGE